MKVVTQAEIDAMPYEQYRQFADRTTGWLRMRSKEWNAAWKNLIQLTGDKDFEALCRGEAWQYMGSDSWTGRWAHYFRHRHHPKTLTQMRLRVPATEGWTPKTEEARPKRKKRTVH